MGKKNELQNVTANTEIVNANVTSAFRFIGQFVTDKPLVNYESKTDSNGNSYEVATVTTDKGKFAIANPTTAKLVNDCYIMNGTKEAATIAFYAKLAYIDHLGDYKKAFAVDNIGDFASLVYGKNGKTVKLYVRTINAFYNISDDGENVTPKCDFMDNASLSNLALALSILAQKCGNDVRKFEEMYLATGELHLNAKQPIFKKEVKAIMSEIDSATTPETTPTTGENATGDTTLGNNATTPETGENEVVMTPEMELNDSKLEAISQLGYISSVCERVAPEKIDRITELVNELMEILA